MRSRTVAWIGLAAGLGLVALLVVAGTLRPPSPEPEGPLAPRAGTVPVRAAGVPEPSGSGARRDPGEPRRDGAPVPPHAPPVAAESGVPADEEAAPSPALVRRAFESALAERFPDLSLSPEEIEHASSSLIELRRARVALRSLPPDAAHAEERRRLIERIGAASGRFSEVLGMDPAEFTARAEPGIGVDAHDPEETVPEPEFLERRP